MPEGTNHSKTKTRQNFIFIILKKQRFSFPNVYFGEVFVWELKPSEILDCEANTFLRLAGRERGCGWTAETMNVI